MQYLQHWFAVYQSTPRTIKCGHFDAEVPWVRANGECVQCGASAEEIARDRAGKEADNANG